eukprot:TRINITY_DN13890_c0_g1_i1.p1 TRINITY_DN13890_c0_g1~~TRINITY_DN13890_c0_g1_i1.p1  ORF type:complete len:157 (+),score=40.40 TRINITY_DN13890_c0_g1_i1:39-473(+)
MGTVSQGQGHEMLIKILLVLLCACVHDLVAEYWFYQSEGGQQGTGFATGTIQDPAEIMKDQDTFELVDFDHLKQDGLPASTYKLKPSSPQTNPNANSQQKLGESAPSLSPVSHILGQETSSTTPALAVTTESSTFLSKLLSIFQ